MLSNNVTVCIFAFNESARILRCIENFKDIFPIIVIDNYSTDNMRELITAEGYRYTSIKNPGFIETPEVMDKVEAAVDTDYVLIASVSEFVPMQLLQRYADAAENNSHDVVRAFRVSITSGEAIPISGQPRKGFPGELRFYKKGAVDYTGNQVHDRGRMLCAPERVLDLGTNETCQFYQFRDYDCARTERTHAIYNDVLAKQKYDAGTRFSWLKMIAHSSKQFLNSYVRFGSWRFGMLGFLHSFYRWHMEIGIWLRIWEWENNLSGNGVKDANNKIRAQFEKKIAEEKVKLK